MNLDDMNVDVIDNIETQEFSLNMGPQHPSTHGVYRAVLIIDGEYIKNAENKVGYLHRGMEKLAETRTYTQFIPYTDRMDYVSGMLNNMAYVTAVEKLAGIEVPERAEYIRVIMAELQRIASHLVYLGSFSIDLNAVSGWMYAFTLREKVLDLLEMTSGSRMTVSYMRIGGVADDLPEGFGKSITDFLVEARERINELETFVAGNEIFVARTKNIGILDAQTAIKYGVTGPNLRAAGVSFDLRKNAPYSVYDRLDFEVPVMKVSDCYDRFMIRFLEIKQSLRIIEQAYAALPEGPVISKVPRVLKPPKGEVYSHIESSKGLLGFHIVSDGSTKPYRLHIHSPSFVNIGIIPVLAKGMPIQDFICLIASIDFILGEVDR